MVKKQRNNKQVIIASSYKDPSGFIFQQEGKIYRQINNIYKSDFEKCKDSGLFSALMDKSLLVKHNEIKTMKPMTKDGFCVVFPEKIPFISYPYEWSFSMLKDAALLTLNIQKIALEKGLSLKDASAYNVQFNKGRPIFIDTLSFETYIKDKPWVAYRQFCQHFLAPLALYSYCDMRFIPLLKDYLDGFPLDFASKLLPKKTYLNTGLFMHIHAHSRTQTALSNRKVRKAKTVKLSKTALLSIINSLENTVKSLNLKKSKTQWGNYYEDTNYSSKAFDHKKQIVKDYIKLISDDNKTIVLDLGANDGEFSRLAISNASLVISTDYDSIAVEKNYLNLKQNKETKLLPLLLDITNPSSDIGFNNEERISFFKRSKIDCIMTLALIHHLVITFNLPLYKIASFFARLIPYLIIEFIPKDDSQVMRLLQNREDIFNEYTKPIFENTFAQFFTIQKQIQIKDSKRIIYLMKST